MTRTAPRRGFTLVELLVAVAIAIVILSLAIYIVNTATFESYKVVGSGDRLSQWLMQARSRALRDKSPRGLRLFVVNNQVKECAFIEQPEPWLPADPSSQFQILYRWNGTDWQTRPNQMPNAVSDVPNNVFQRVYLTLTQNDRTAFDSAGIKSGDTIVIPELNQAILLVADPIIGPAAGPGVPLPPTPPPPGVTYTVYELRVAQLPDLGAAHSSETNQSQVASFQTNRFGIHRQPQILLGEPNHLLSSTMVVDVTPDDFATPLPRDESVSWKVPRNAAGDIDVVFAPGGEVINSNAGLIVFVIRDSNKAATVDLRRFSTLQTAGQMTTVVVYTKTGAIATHPLNLPTNPAIDPDDNLDPYQFAKDAINTGL